MRKNGGGAYISVVSVGIYFFIIFIYWMLAHNYCDNIIIELSSN